MGQLKTEKMVLCNTNTNDNMADNYRGNLKTYISLRRWK
jgi:hypothetical protein